MTIIPNRVKYHQNLYNIPDLTRDTTINSR